ncbi:MULTISPECIES: methylated-DNA--[protein]-cysteine S-methyltransferase [unclassified Lactococcus]|uniref:methylated-DNA--[protein]-cysteine S-methyltransferase n=1 Tax=unclassified Lactococcus TaxID=2643510 RepID=UPI0011CB2D13|nr:MULTISPECIES: methylated-DNA--[protein]-cysteine S-methyltransferase [unclassified Lactococcus]MQW23796.1 methylated-DNA--[protein]-cysteine S-methyltransferase [Lactococcus sp. dk101]TXK37380.1 methylated-DNA--[protein]-cysteine S-methyltransferase [Lactococcus sp. dk310]TXK48691.1 methylated-DNA--[protein]-cysteine S-methyltransferase [Lactococcus sp. dk322]
MKIWIETYFNSPIGQLVCLSDEAALFRLDFADAVALETVRADENCQIKAGQTQISRQLEKELTAYFDGESFDFTVPYYLTGTPFQNAVWQAVSQIPFGNRSTYQYIAKRLNKPKASRAVGSANAKNQLAIIIPCHRLVRADGKLANYAGGLWRKEWLLAHEEALFMKNEGK